MSIAALARARLSAVTIRARSAFAAITDWRGEKVNPAALKKPGEKRQTKRASTPFGADPEKLVALFKKADDGEYEEQHPDRVPDSEADAEVDDAASPETPTGPDAS